MNKIFLPIFVRYHGKQNGPISYLAVKVKKIRIDISKIKSVLPAEGSSTIAVVQMDVRPSIFAKLLPMLRHDARFSPAGSQRPYCDSKRVIRRGVDEKGLTKQRYECKNCKNRLDDPMGTIFTGHHQPLKAWQSLS